jgi:hypothetical protein
LAWTIDYRRIALNPGVLTSRGGGSMPLPILYILAKKSCAPAWELSGVAVTFGPLQQFAIHA